MNVIDIANNLGQEIKKSEEYLAFKEIKERINSNPELKSKIDEFEKVRYNVQVSALQNDGQDQSGMQQLQQIYEMLMQDEIIKEYFDKQVRFNVMIADINKIIGNSIKDLL